MKTVNKGLLIFPILKDLNKADGILVKNEGIAKGFLQNGIQVDVLEFNTKGIFNGIEQVYAFHPSRYKRIYQYNTKAWRKISDYISGKEYDFIWFRMPIANSPIAHFVKKLKGYNSQCKIIIEYGAYPYINELSGLKKILYLLNKGNEKIVHRNVDFMITYCGQYSVDNVLNIPINNGIDISNIPVVNHALGGFKQVRFICVSSLKKWHAYERFISGLPAYIQNGNEVPVHFDIVGNGPEYEKLVRLVADLNMTSHVTFHNFKTGKELDKIYEENHIAIGTLGFHRIGITNSSSLKNREYFARGLPIVLSTTDLDMPSDLPYVKYVPEGEEPVDIAALVAFAREVYSHPNINQTIRSYADLNISWASKIQIVLNYLNLS